MSYFSAKLFVWLEGAEFYKNLHEEVLKQIPGGEGKEWLDVGCGPGLLTRLAAIKGYRAIGIDGDASMIREAKRVARKEGSSARFEIGDVFHLPKERADVISASSLLTVLDDKTAGLHALFGAVKPGGMLIIIEPTERMTSHAAAALIRKDAHGKRISGLRLWARARQGRTVDPEIFNALGASKVVFVSLLLGLVGAWFIHKKLN